MLRLFGGKSGIQKKLDGGHVLHADVIDLNNKIYYSGCKVWSADDSFHFMCPERNEEGCVKVHHTSHSDNFWCGPDEVRVSTVNGSLYHVIFS